VLHTFYGVPNAHIPYYILPFAFGNILGPLVLGRFFDVVGRRVMITLCYGVSGVFLAITAVLFQQGVLTALTQTIAWTVIFFFASAAASSAYLTVSEVFPLEIRALAIALFYAVATAIGGISGPLLFGILVGTGRVNPTAVGFLIGAVWLIAAAIAEAFLGVDAEQKSLEEIAEPLSSADGEERKPARKPVSQRRLSSPRPSFAGVPAGLEHDVDREVEAIAAAVAAHSPISRAELAREVHASRWGPGRFSVGLRVARGEGRIRQSGRGRYVAGT
jgi:MFS family permease